MVANSKDFYIFMKTFFAVAICMLFLYFKVVRTRNGLGSLGNHSSDDPDGNGEADEGILYQIASNFI